MIEFDYLEYKNILATGNHPIRIDFNKTKHTLVFGKNGRGKSTLISSLSYCLFGKDFRGITKDKLVNSINKKNAETEVGFRKNGASYVIKRGIKPDTFTVTKDGVDVAALGASKKELQDFLETHILGFGYDTFKQIVVIASGKYQPFMLLKAAERRRVTETILGLDVFSDMQDIIKRHNDNLTTSITDVDKKMVAVNTKANSTKDVIARLEKKKNEGDAEKRHQIEALTSEIEALANALTGLNEEHSKLSQELLDTTKYEEAENKIRTRLAQINAETSTKKKEADFLKSNTSCPTCRNPFDTKDRETKITLLCEEIKGNSDASNELLEKQNRVQKFLSEMKTKANAINNLSQRVALANQKIKDKNDMIKFLQNEMAKAGANDDNDISALRSEIDGLNVETDKLRSERDDLYRKREVINISKLLMKDTGIKSEVINQYIPLFNELMNEYLAKMDFYCEFTLDSNFEETIKSRYRDNFKYENFSEGEKQRIDLAILFAWREIARRRNNINTNLLILDEIADSSMDSEGISSMLSIFDTLNTNILIISHSEVLKEHITNTIEFVKENNFSVMKDNR